MKKLIILGLFLVFVTAGCSLTGNGSVATKVSLEEAKIIVADFINDNLMQPGSKVSIKEVVEEETLYRVIVNMPGDQEIISYLTKDGKRFFPQAMDIEELKKEALEKQAAEPAAPSVTAADLDKTEKPTVELFVMSHCPYGTQIEKGILPVVKTLGDKINFELKFCNYVMHGKKEIDEQLNQYCIQKNEPEKFLGYLECFLEADDGDGCLIKSRINVAKLRTCVSSTDKQYKITEMFDDKSTWSGGRYPKFMVNDDDNKKYGIAGSPGLVINGQKLQSGRDSATLLKNICAGFDNPPTECNETLSSASPSPGFGFGTTGGDATGDCGS